MGTGSERDAVSAFEEWFLRVEPRLRRALVAAYGLEDGREATAVALAWAWEHRDRLAEIDNPVAYLYRVARSRTRRRKRRVVYERDTTPDLWVEPKLDAALRRLSRSQRVAVVLVCGHGWTHSEVAELLGVRPTTVQNHLERGMRRLRADLEVTVE